MAANRPKKKQLLRNNEYYGTQELFDELYQRSQNGEKFTHLMELITSEQNILLEYRTIKKNKGNKTKDKAQGKCKENIRKTIALMGKEPSQRNITRFNAVILGLHEYYKIVTNVYLNFDRIAFDVRKTLLCRTKSHRSKTGWRSPAFQQFYGDFTGKMRNLQRTLVTGRNGSPSPASKDQRRKRQLYKSGSGNGRCA